MARVVGRQRDVVGERDTAVWPVWGHIDRPPPPQSPQDSVSSSVSISTADADAIDDDVAEIFFAGSQEWPLVEHPRPQPDREPPDRERPDPDPPDVGLNPNQADTMSESAETPYESQWLTLLDPDNDPALAALMQSGEDSALVDATSATAVDIDSQSVSNPMAEGQGNNSLANCGHQSTSQANRRGLAESSSLTYDDEPDLGSSSAGQELIGEEGGGGGGIEDRPANSNSDLWYV